MATEQAAQSVSEDWLSVWIGLFIFVLSLGVMVGADVLGWGITTAVWTDLGKALLPVSKAYAGPGDRLARPDIPLPARRQTIGATALSEDRQSRG
jgi:hypothetical protein